MNTLGTGTPLALVHNTELNFRAYNIDRAENISIAASSEVTLNVDFDAPSLVQITSNQFDDHYKEGEVISLVAVFNDGDDVTDEQDYVFIVEDATLDLTLNVGTAALGYVTKTITAAEMATNLGTVDYTVGSGEGHWSRQSKVKVTGIAISAANMLRDGSGNIVEGTEDLTDISLIGITNLDDATDGKSIYADGWSPAAPTIESITTDVVPKVDLDDNQTDYWNVYNTQAIFMVNVVADASMGDGNITILARTGSRAYAVIMDVSEGDPFSEPVSTTQALGSEVSITITDDDLDAIIGWPTATTSTGDVDFKARSTDLAGNTTETGDADKVTIHVDEIVPAAKNSSDATPLTGMTTKVRDNPTHSVTVQGYWNIDTDYLEVDVGDLTGLDDNIVDGEVQLYGKISASVPPPNDWTTLGSERTISAGNLGDFSIEVSEYGDWGTGLQTDAAPNGVKELHKGGLTWDDMDGNTIDIKVRITDAAGNYTEYSNDIAVFALTNSRYITIDGTREGHRPLIVEVTSDKANGWWGPQSDNKTITLQVKAKDDEAITVTGGPPFIQLETGPEEIGVASYKSGTTAPMEFEYEIGDRETTLGNLPDGNLQLRLTPHNIDGEAIIDLNGAVMHSQGGNLLRTGVVNTTSPLLPKPNNSVPALNPDDDPTIVGEDEKYSLDEKTNLIIDGVKPYEVYVAGTEFDQRPIYIDLIETPGEENRIGYYNYRTETISFRFYFRNTSQDITIPQLGIDDAEVDRSLALLIDPSCNRAVDDCGKVQIKVRLTEIGENPGSFVDMALATNISYDDLTTGNGGSYSQTITYDASPLLNTAVAGTDDFEALNALKVDAVFVDHYSLSFSLEIIDLAGNKLETVAYSTEIIVDQTPPNGLTTTVVATNAGDGEFYNIKSGYWNSHNTGIKLTVPLPSDDETLTNGTIQILGKKTGGAWERLGIHDVNDANYDPSYNIDATEYANNLSVIPSSTSELVDPNSFLIDPDPVDVTNKYVEDITGFDEGATLIFTARVFDVAGNYTDWDESLTTLTVDQTVPTVEVVTSDVGLNTTYYYKAGGIVTIIVDASEGIFDTRGPEGSREAFGTDSDYSTLELDVGDGGPILNQEINTELMVIKSTIPIPY